MLDLFGISFTTIVVFLLVMRSIGMDRVEPWFQTFKPRDGAKQSGSKIWQRGR
ncbi:MAG TPA: hypothetical protein VFG62_17850 [Rhodopila sp.]|jgi:hypothetical protein|nr:hypothetical protein [Rhodopila sp.]